MHSGYPLALEPLQTCRSQLQEVLPGARRITPQASDVDAVACIRKRRQKADAMVELDCRAVKVAVFQQVVHAHANLQDAFVQVANLARRGAPEQLERLVLLEEFAGVELMDRLQQGWWRGLRAQRSQIRGFQALERADQLWMGGARVGGCQPKGYTCPRYFEWRETNDDVRIRSGADPGHA